MHRFLLLLAFLLAACTSTTTTTPASDTKPAAENESESGTPTDDTSAATPAGPVAFTQAEVQDLIDTKCVRCHTGGADKPFDLRNDFTATTIGVTADGRSKCADSATQTRIVPGRRDASLLWRKVNGTHDCGDAMPPPGKGTKLTAAQLERLGLYIDSLGRQ